MARVKYCPNCGKENINNGAFCTYCGFSLPELVVPTSSIQNAKPVNEGSKVTKIEIPKFVEKTKENVSKSLPIISGDSNKKAPIKTINKVLVGCVAVLILLTVIGSQTRHKHTWQEATCVAPETCSECGATQGEPLGHDFTPATCKDPMICKRCGTKRGNPNTDAHSVSNWTVTEESTCNTTGTQEGTCDICGETIIKAAPLASHVPGDEIVALEATPNNPGRIDTICSVCGEVCNSRTYELSAEDYEEYYKNNCETFAYKDLARYPDEYKGKFIRLRGEVVQTMENFWGNGYTYRVDVTYNGYYWEDTVYVTYKPKDSNEPRILEDDIVVIYGVCTGEETYTSILGATITIPSVQAEYIEIEE